eukprot:1270851-Pyramimonas_sp.AAC.1
MLYGAVVRLGTSGRDPIPRGRMHVSSATASAQKDSSLGSTMLRACDGCPEPKLLCTWKHGQPAVGCFVWRPTPGMENTEQCNPPPGATGSTAGRVAIGTLDGIAGTVLLIFGAAPSVINHILTRDTPS